MRNFVNHEIVRESINVDTIDTLIHSLYTLLQKYSDNHYTGYFYGYYDIRILERKFTLGYDYLVNLENLKFRVKNESKCLCEKDSEKLIEDVRTIVGSCDRLRLDLISDSTNYDQWVLENPDRVPREVWEECLYTKCDKVTYNLVRDLNHAKTQCKVVYDLVAYFKECNFTYKVTNESKNCEADYKLLVTETKCDLTYNDYVEVIKCGASFDLVKTVVNCGATIEVSKESDCLEVTYNLKKYPINCYE